MLTLPNMTKYNNERGSTMYMSLYESFRKSIIEQNMLPNEKLPSKRVLANKLGISVKTVENAYEQLLLEGYIYSREKSGYFVSEIESIPSAEKSKRPVQISRYQQTEYKVNLRANRNAKEDFPEDTWCRLMRETLNADRDRLFATVPFNGLFELRSAIADFLRTARGMDVSPDCIIISAGTEYMYSRLIQVFGSDTVYALPDPSSKRLYELYDNNNLKYNAVHATRSGFDFDEFENCDSNVLHISPAHQYPLGKVMPIQERMRLLQWANQSEDRYIIEDDYDSEYVVAGHPIPPIYSIDKNDKVIYMNTFSKSISAAVRISYMILPEKLMQRYLDTMSFYGCTVASMEQLTLTKFIEGRHLERLFHRVARKNQKIRQQVINVFDELQSDGCIELESDCAGAMLLVRLNTPKTDQEIKYFLKSKSVITSMMSEYYRDAFLKDKYAKVMIVNYSGMTDAKIEYLGQVVRELTGDRE